MTAVLLTGAGGRLGRRLAGRLRDAGYDVRAAGRRGPVKLDLGTGDGLQEALRDVSIVVHAASSPFRAPERVDVEGTAALCAAARAAGVEHIVFPGIVGSDAVPVRYYAAKVAAERAIAASGVPFTVQRTTQFHAFVTELLTMLPCGVCVAPQGWRLQPVDEDAVADVLLEHVRAGPRGRAMDVGGPEIMEVRELARRLGRRPLVFPVPGAASAAMRRGALCCPTGRQVGRPFSAAT